MGTDWYACSYCDEAYSEHNGSQCCVCFDFAGCSECKGNEFEINIPQLNDEQLSKLKKENIDIDEFKKMDGKTVYLCDDCFHVKRIVSYEIYDRDDFKTMISLYDERNDSGICEHVESHDSSLYFFTRKKKRTNRKKI